MALKRQHRPVLALAKLGNARRRRVARKLFQREMRTLLTRLHRVARIRENERFVAADDQIRKRPRKPAEIADVGTIRNEHRVVLVSLLCEPRLKPFQSFFILHR